MANDDDVLLPPMTPPVPTATSDTNMFGGKNPHGLYVPMSEDEQEVLQRLVETQDLVVIIHGWGVLDSPRVSFGDFRVSIPMTINFDRPAVPVDVWFLDLELKSKSTGMTLVKQRQSTVYDNQPIQVVAGMELDMVWDIAIHHMSPEFVKAIKPGALGLTSRRLDRETGNATLNGNMKLSEAQLATLEHHERGAARMRAEDVRIAVKATKAAGYEVRETDDGLVAPDLPEPKP
jgi:hypothetical protein